MAFAASVIRTVSGLEVEVMHAYARIVEGTDPEALHDLRVAARRLRSLLKPLRLGALAEDLDRAAKALGQATNPIRDMEVMAAELERHGLLIPASLRRQAVLRWYRQAGSSPQIKDLLDALDAWPDGVRRAMTEGRLDDLEAEASKRIRHQLRKLLAALDDPGHDLHDIRLLVKRARYSQEAYPDLCPLPGKVLDTLKTLQTMLGGLARPPAMVPQGR
ncbi:CHAD domain-containing protein [Pseudomonas aeruginosa]|nr:CHAD domain-containing protein [Pseudomonas aeruginosa]